MIRVIETIIIKRPVEEVFEFVTNPDNAPLWVTGLTEMRQTKGNRMRVGAKGVQVRPVLGRKLEVKWEVVEFERNKSMVAEVRSGPLRSLRFAESVSPIGDVGTQFTFSAEGKSRGFFALADSLVNKMYERQVRSDLGNLKELLELDEEERVDFMAGSIKYEENPGRLDRDID